MGPHEDARDRAAWDLIPWVVGGSASAGERSLVERHVAVCPDCAAELAFQRTLRAAVAASAAAAPPVDGEAPLRQLMARIEADEAGRQRGRPATRAPRWLVAAAVLQAVALAGLLGARVERGPPADYTTLGRPDPSRATLRLVPAPQMSLRDLQALLARLDLQIVDTSADGTLFGLVPRRADRLGEALAALRGMPGVLLAEPIGAAVPASGPP